MGRPKMRRVETGEEYTWEFDVINPLPPLGERLRQHFFEDLKESESKEVIAVNSLGSRVYTLPASQQVFPIDVNVSMEQIEKLRIFFSDPAFWFFPDSERHDGYLVTYFPNEFDPQASDSGRYIVTGELIQLGKETRTDVNVTDPVLLDPPLTRFRQQVYVTSGFSLWENNQSVIYIFPESETSDSDWTILDNHFIRHETLYADRYGRLLFNWVRNIKRRYRLFFDGIDINFHQRILQLVSQRVCRFYPNVNINLRDPVQTDFILPPHTEGIPFINCRVLEQDLQTEYGSSYYATSLILEEL